MEIVAYIILAAVLIVNYNLYQLIKFQNKRHNETMNVMNFLIKRIEDLENGKLKDIELRISKINKAA